MDHFSTEHNRLQATDCHRINAETSRILRPLTSFTEICCTSLLYNVVLPGLEVGRCGPVWQTGTFYLATWTAYRHFFSNKRHTGMFCRQFSEI